MPHTTSRRSTGPHPGTHPRPRRRTAALILLAASVPGLAACTGSSEAPAPTSSWQASFSAATRHPLDGASAAQVLDAARTALVTAPIVRATGRLAVGTSVVGFDLATRQDGQGSGWFSPGPNAGRAALKVIGANVYVGGDDAYHRAALGPGAVALLHGKWVVTARTDPAVARMMSFVDRRSLARTALQLDAATVTVSPDGKQFLLRSGTLTLAVSRDALTRPLSVREDKSAPANTSAITFVYPTAVDLSPPPAASVVRRSSTPAKPSGKATSSTRT